MTPQRSPDNSGKKCFLTIFSFCGDHSLSSSCAKRRFSPCARIRSSSCKRGRSSFCTRRSIVITRKVEDGQKTLFPRIVRGPLGCHLLSSLVPKSRFRGSGKKFFSSCKMRFKMMQNYPLSIFHASVWPESSPGADLSTFQKIRFSLFSSLFGLFRAQLQLQH